jgi:hypothetical protein
MTNHDLQGSSLPYFHPASDDKDQVLFNNSLGSIRNRSSSHSTLRRQTLLRFLSLAYLHRMALRLAYKDFLPLL